MTGKSLGPMYRGEKPLETALLPTGLRNEFAQHAVDFWLTREDLPDSQNRVTVDRSGNLTLSYTPNNQVPQQKLFAKLKSMLSHLGIHPEHPDPAQHLYKDCNPDCRVRPSSRHMSLRHKTSVLDTNCKAHELDNLHVWSTRASSSASAR